MGYRSDVAIMAVVGSKEHADEVMAIYRMNEKVREHNVEASWRRVEMDNGAVVLIFEEENIKFYDTYHDVQAVLHMQDVLGDFGDQRKDFNFAWGKAIIGEETNDIEFDVYAGGEGDKDDLCDIVYDNLGISRRLEVGL